MVVQLLSHVWLFATPRTAARQAPLSPGVCSDSCPLSQWYYATILSSVAPFFFCLQSVPASGPFPMSWLFACRRTYFETYLESSVKRSTPLNLSFYFLSFFPFWPHHAAGRILVPHQRWNPYPLQWKHGINSWTTGEVSVFFCKFLFYM